MRFFPLFFPRFSSTNRDMLCRYKSIIMTTLESAGQGLAHILSLRYHSPHFTPSLSSASSLSPPQGYGSYEVYSAYAHLTSSLPQIALARILATSGIEPAEVGSSACASLAGALGGFVGKVSMIRNVASAIQGGECLWPRDLLSAHGFSSPEEMLKSSSSSTSLSSSSPDSDARKWVISEMVLDALVHIPPALDFLKLLKKQEDFNLCAVPLALGVAILEGCFMNDALFSVAGGGVRLRKAEAADVSSLASFLENQKGEANNGVRFRCS